jgi:hypothetical protein
MRNPLVMLLALGLPLALMASAGLAEAADRHSHCRDSGVCAVFDEALTAKSWTDAGAGAAVGAATFDGAISWFGATHDALITTDFPGGYSVSFYPGVNAGVGADPTGKVVFFDNLAGSSTDLEIGDAFPEPGYDAEGNVALAVGNSRVAFYSALTHSAAEHEFPERAEAEAGYDVAAAAVAGVTGTEAVFFDGVSGQLHTTSLDPAEDVVVDSGGTVSVAATDGGAVAFFSVGLPAPVRTRLGDLGVAKAGDGNVALAADVGGEVAFFDHQSGTIATGSVGNGSGLAAAAGFNVAVAGADNGRVLFFDAFRHQIRSTDLPAADLVRVDTVGNVAMATYANGWVAFYGAATDTLVTHEFPDEPLGSAGFDVAVAAAPSLPVQVAIFDGINGQMVTTTLGSDPGVGVSAGGTVAVAAAGSGEIAFYSTRQHALAETSLGSAHPDPPAVLAGWNVGVAAHGDGGTRFYDAFSGKIVEADPLGGGPLYLGTSGNAAQALSENGKTVFFGAESDALIGHTLANPSPLFMRVGWYASVVAGGGGEVVFFNDTSGRKTEVELSGDVVDVGLIARTGVAAADTGAQAEVVFFCTEDDGLDRRTVGSPAEIGAGFNVSVASSLTGEVSFHDALVHDADLDGLDDVGQWDFCPGTYNPDSRNADWDWAGDACDCAPDDGNTYPGAPEVNDGRDNQCSGEPGHGVADEITGTCLFADGTFFCPPQMFATSYEGARSSFPDFSEDCLTEELGEPRWDDSGGAPGPGLVFYYLMRSLTPNPGSWGQCSSGEERTVCP